MSFSTFSLRRVAPAAAAALVLVGLPVGAQQATPPRSPSVDTLPRPAANPADVSSPDAIIKALYDVISGPAGQKRDWNRMRSLFVPHARLIPTRVRADSAADAIVLSVDDYISRAGPGLEQNGFFERELARKTESFGSIMHVFSTYDSKRTAQDEKPFARGINSIQLLRDGNRWWVVSVFWDSERPGNPIPEKYLK
jgi:hypothetical protein